MNKKILISVGVIIVVATAFWLISPLWNNIELNEELPQANTDSTQMDSSVKPEVMDNMDSMSADQKMKFVAETEKMKVEVMQKSEPMPANESGELGRATLVPRAHEVSGEAVFVSVANKRFLRFENLDTINGPDLKVYLSSDLSDSDIVDLGPIRATKGNVNYEIPAGTDLNKYKNVMIWCKAFGILFSYATIEV